MKIVFFGTPELAVPSLEAVADRHQVLAVVCQPDKPKGRKKKLVAPPVKVWALAHDIEVLQPAKLNDGSFEAWLKEKAPEVCVLAAYGRILKQPILDVPTQGFLNVHPSLLPEYRGPSPIRSAVLNGDKTTGVTIMRLDAGTDTGDILLQREEPILVEDTSVTLSARLANIGAEMMIEALGLVEDGRADYKPQDGDKATYTKMFEKKDGRIDWGRPAREIHNLVRAAQPWPVAHCEFDGGVCRIHKTEIVEASADAVPGTVTQVDKDRVVLATGEGQLAIMVFQAAGKRAMPMGDFLRGRAINVGDVFRGCT